MSANQFYFSKEKIQALLDLYSSDEFQKAMGGRPFRGLLITPGQTPDGKDAAFGYGVFGNSGGNMRVSENGGGDDTIYYPNNDPQYSGCPSPPAC
jgi:hypothetical protein